MACFVDLRRAGALLSFTAATVVSLAAAPPITAAAEVLEYAVKATFLYKFGAFVEWPGTTFTSPTSAAKLCIVGEDQVGNALASAVVGQKIAERDIQLEQVTDPAAASGCQILYVADRDPQRAAKALKAVQGAGVLTVTDAARSAESTGMINFVVSENRVRFEIDVGAAARSGLVISSKLLGLAKSVKGKG